MANLETGVSRNQSTQSFPKNEHFLPPDTHLYVQYQLTKQKFPGILFQEQGNVILRVQKFANLGQFCKIHEILYL